MADDREIERERERGGMKWKSSPSSSLAVLTVVITLKTYKITTEMA